jgi:hypothetical protein
MSDRSTNPRVTACIVRTEAGNTYSEYEIGGVEVSSTDALEAMLNAR